MAKRKAATPAPETDPADNRPICPYHGEVCVSKHSSNAVTYYYCPTDGCRYAAKRLRRDFANKMARDRELALPRGQAEGAPRA